MLELTVSDRNIIKSSYDLFLRNLYDFLKSSSANTGVEYARLIIGLLHSGKFGMSGTNICTNDYDFLHLANLDTDGLLVMYGVCCCRHATSLLYDVLIGLGIDCSLMYIFVGDGGTWKVTDVNSANHVVVKLEENGKEYLIDSINKFILEMLDNGELKQLEIEDDIDFDNYSDSNIEKIGKVLTKYYNLKRMGIEHVYDY